jgi:hypothetical protein
MEARSLWERDVAGSSPARPTKAAHERGARAGLEMPGAKGSPLGRSDALQATRDGFDSRALHRGVVVQLGGRGVRNAEMRVQVSPIPQRGARSTGGRRAGSAQIGVRFPGIPQGDVTSSSAPAPGSRSRVTRASGAFDFRRGQRPFKPTRRVRHPHALSGPCRVRLAGQDPTLSGARRGFESRTRRRYPRRWIRHRRYERWLRRFDSVRGCNASGAGAQLRLISAAWSDQHRPLVPA